MFKVGDRYVQFINGEINMGLVKQIQEVVICDKPNMISYVAVSITNENDVVLELDGTDGRIYRIIKDLSENDLKMMQSYMHNVHVQPSIDVV